jgi:hypothetical protein
LHQAEADGAKTRAVATAGSEYILSLVAVRIGKMATADMEGAKPLQVFI